MKPALETCIWISNLLKHDPWIIWNDQVPGCVSVCHFGSSKSLLCSFLASCLRVCVCPRLSLRFSRFYSAGVAESQKKQVQLADKSTKKENDKFSRFYFAGGARTFGASCANEDTHHWLCKRTCRHAMGTVVCSLGANTNINFLTR